MLLRRNLLLFAGFLVSGCTVHVPVVENGRFACHTDSDCSAGRQCVQGLCTGATGTAGTTTAGGTGGASTGGASTGGSTSAGVPDASHSTLVVSSTDATAGDSISLTVQVRDASNTLLANQLVVFAATGSNNQFSEASGTTNSSGSFSTNLSSQKAEDKVVTATAGSMVLSVQITFVPGAPALTTSTLTATPSTVIADLANDIALQVIARDAYSNPVPNVAITVDSNATHAAYNGDATASNLTGTTDANGTVAGTLSASVPQSAAVTAHLPESVILQAGVVFTAGHPALANSSLAISPNQRTADGSSTVQFTVTAHDANNYACVNKQVVLTSTGSQNTVAPSAAVLTDINGQAQFTAKSTLAQFETFTATVDGLALQGNVRFVAGPVVPGSSVFYVGPAALMADELSVLTVSLQLFDANNNPVANQNVTFSSTGSQNFGMPVTGPTDANGTFARTMFSPTAEVKTIAATTPSFSQPLNANVTFVAGFNPQILLSSCNGPSSLAAAPVSGQNYADIIVACESDSHLNVYNTSNGHGLGLSSIVSTGLPTTLGMDTGDINHDGRMDLVAAVTGANEVFVYLNTNRAYSAHTTINTGSSPEHVALRDINDDGDLDLLVTSYGSTQLACALGNGTGTFATPAVNTVGTNPRGFAVADFDNDGIQDVMVANANAPYLSFLRGNRTCTFTPGTNPNVLGGGAIEVVPVDWDLDGVMDILSTNDNFSDVALQFGLGGGTFNVGTSLGLDGPVHDLAVGDFNHDGNPDFMAVLDSTNQLFWMYGTGSRVGSFSGAQRYSTPDPTTLTMADFDYDGRVDAVINSLSLDEIHVIMNNLPNTGCDGTFVPGDQIAVDPNVQSIALADWNRDHNLDVLMTHCCGNANVTVALSDGAGGLAAPTRHTLSGSPYAVTLRDMNIDAKPDLVVTNPGNTAVEVYPGTTTVGTFGPVVSKAAPLSPTTMLLADVDNNGHADVLALDGNVLVYTSDSNGTLTTPSTLPVGANAMAVGDFDLNGWPDVAVANANANQISVVLNSNGVWQTPQTIACDAPVGIAAGHAMGNPNVDLMVISATSSNVLLFANNGNAVFGGSSTAASGGAAPSTLLATDLNNDSLTDFVVASANPGGGVTVLVNQGSGGFVATNYPITGKITAVAAGNMHGALRADLLVATGNTLQMLNNRGCH